MNPEHQPPHNLPETPGGPAIPSPEPHTVQPTTRHEMLVLERLHDEHGVAFQVYLDHVWDGTTPIMNMETDFENVYWASYAHIEQFVDDFIESLGWAEARTQLLKDQAIPESVLVFNRKAFLETIRGDYEFYEQGGEIHVFVK